MKIEFQVSTDVSSSARVKQIGAMFDVPLTEKNAVSWSGEFPYENEPWQIGAIVGPSGSGKSQIMRHVFGESPELEWKSASVIDDFDTKLSITEIASACQSVGFNTITSWMRPHNVLSNGEKFRIEMARRLLESGDLIVVDEFTSVVDRQVAQIGSYAVQKYIRQSKTKKFVAVSCHYDILDWLQPDWIFEPATMSFSRRLLRRRPELEIEISRVPYSAWKLFAPFHYLTNTLNPSARCFVLFVNGSPACFAGVLPRPNPGVRNIYGVSRLVTLPDWQGLGLAMILAERLGAAYKTVDYQLRLYPAHPPFIRSIDRSSVWKLETKPGLREINKTRLKNDNYITASGRKKNQIATAQGGRPCAVFSYAGEKMDENIAKSLIYSTVS
jgi:energy-coupling factor transporter ATP-binding protein EcfA2